MDEYLHFISQACNLTDLVVLTLVMILNVKEFFLDDVISTMLLMVDVSK